jgi:hypothetical protein
LAKWLNGLIKLSKPNQRGAEAIERERFTRIRGCPRPRQLQRLVPRLNRVTVIPPRNEEPLALADAVAQLERAL